MMKQNRVLNLRGKKIWLFVLLLGMVITLALAVDVLPASADTTVTVGSYPEGVAVNPETDTIYVANSVGNSVSVIDGSDNTVTKTIGVGNSPKGAAVNPKTDTIYVANFGGNSVSVIDGVSKTVTGTISVGNSPWGVAVNPETNTIYVANYVGSSVSVIDGVSKTVTGTISVGNSPWGVAVNPETNTIYVANYVGNSVSVIDGVSKTVTGTISVGSSPWGVAVNPETDTIYVTNSDDSSVSVIDGVSNTVTGTISVGNGPLGVAVNPETNTIYVANYVGNSVSVIDGVSKTVTKTISVENYPEGVAVNPETDTIYVANSGGNTVSVIDGVSKTVITALAAGSSPEEIAVNPVNHSIYATNVYSAAVTVIELTVSNIAVKTAPDKVVYTDGESLNLTGLVVTLTWSDGSAQDVAFADFADYGITTDKTNGDVLSAGDTQVAITANGHTVKQAITVNMLQVSGTVTDGSVTLNSGNKTVSGSDNTWEINVTNGTLKGSAAYELTDDITLTNLPSGLNYTAVNNGSNNLLITVSGTAVYAVDSDATVTIVIGSNAVSESLYADSKDISVHLYHHGQTLSSISISPSANSVEKNKTTQVTVTAGYDDGSTADVTGNCTYSMADSSIASVSDRGLIRGLKTGSTVLTATYGGKSATVTVQVRSSGGGGGGGGGSSTTAITVVRLFGDNRYRTADAISAKGWTSADTVIVASGENYPDALAGVTLSYLKGAPILLAAQTGPDSSTLQEIQRLQAKNIYILGGEGVINTPATGLFGSSVTVKRLWGTDRYATAVKIGEFIRSDSTANQDTVILATGEDYAGALAAAPYAGKYKIPMLFTTANGLDEETQKALEDWSIKNVIIVGGTGNVSEAAENTIKGLGITTNRISGDDKYLTSLAVAKYFAAKGIGGTLTEIAIATGDDYPDALAGAAFAAKEGCPVLLVGSSGIGDEMLVYIKGLGIKEAYIFGGSGAVPAGVDIQIKNMNQ